MTILQVAPDLPLIRKNPAVRNVIQITLKRVDTIPQEVALTLFARVLVFDVAATKM